MIISEQVALILEAADKGIIQPEDVVQWADSIIAATDAPESWLIELSTLGSTHMQDYVPRLREHSGERMDLRRRTQLVVLAYRSGLLTFHDTLPLLFRVLISERKERERGRLEQRLVDALVSWDCQEDLDVIGPSLRSRFEAIFNEVLSGTGKIASVLPWKFRAEPGASPNGGPAERVGKSEVGGGPPSVS
jgi:hypothetical protein